MTVYNAIALRGKILELIERSHHVGTNVTLYTGPELGRLAEANGLGLAGLRDIGICFDLKLLDGLGYLPLGFSGSPAGKSAAGTRGPGDAVIL